MTIGTVFLTPEAGSYGLSPEQVLTLMDNPKEFKKRMGEVEKVTAALSKERQAAGTLNEIQQLGEDARKDRQAAGLLRMLFGPGGFRNEQDQRQDQQRAHVPCYPVSRF